MKKESIAKAIESMEDEYLLDAIGFKAPKRIRAKHLMIAAAAAFALIAASLFTFFALRTNEPEPVEPAATVYFDAGVSVEIRVDANKTVLSVTGGDDRFDGEEFVGSPIESAFQKLVYQSVDGDRDRSQVVLSVKSDDRELANELSTLLEEQLDSISFPRLPENIVPYKTVTTEKQERISELANAYHIRRVCARYILDILDVSADYTAWELSGYSLEKLIALYGALGLSDNPRSVEELIGTVLEYAGLTQDEITVVDCVFSTYGVQDEDYFEYTFLHGNKQYKYSLDPINGEILFIHIAVVSLTEEDALEAALKHLGAAKEDLTYSEIEYRETLNAWFVTCQFPDGEYRLTVSAETGTTVSSSQRPFRLHAAQVQELVKKDLQLKEESANIPYFYHSAFDGAECGSYAFETSAGNFNYLIDRTTGEILYKEKTKKFASFSSDFALAAACACARYGGAKVVEPIGCGAEDDPRAFTVVLSVDGKTVTYSVYDGHVQND